MKVWGVVVGVLAVGAISVLALVVSGRGWGASAAWEGTPLPFVEPAPPLELPAHDGRVVSLEDFQGRAVVVFFGFTHCPDICPATMGSLARAMELLGTDAADVQVLFVSVDPARDTPERLAGYLRNFHPDFLGLRGSEDRLAEVASAWGAFYQRRELGEASASGGEQHAGHGADQAADPGDGAYLVDHSGRTYVVDRRGRLVLTFPPYLDGQAMAADLARLLDR